MDLVGFIIRILQIALTLITHHITNMLNENIVTKIDTSLCRGEHGREWAEEFLQPTRRKGIFSTNTNCTWNIEIGNNVRADCHTRQTVSTH